MRALHSGELKQDLRRGDCDILTMGQYLQPSAKHRTVHRFVEPAESDIFKVEAKALGFVGIASGSFVRSSYEVEKLYRHAKNARLLR